MKFVRRNEGWSTLNFIISLMVICILVISLGLFVRTININLVKDIGHNKKEDVINSTMTEVLSSLNDDSSPSADSKHDKFFSYDDVFINGCHVSIVPLSGKINVNFFPWDVLVSSELKNLLVNSNSFLSFMTSNEELINDYSVLAEYIDAEKFDLYFTTYGWANYNITQENSIKVLLSAMNINSTFLLNKRKSMLSSKQFVQSYSEYRSVCGVNYKSVMPFMNIEAPLNVNFIDEQILKDILGCSKYKVAGINSKVSAIISQRETKEIDSEKLQAILSLKPNNELYYLLGVNSWFYQINFEYEEVACSVVVAKEVSDDISKNKKHKWYILEKNWK